MTGTHIHIQLLVNLLFLSLDKIQILTTVPFIFMKIYLFSRILMFTINSFIATVILNPNSFLLISSFIFSAMKL